MARRKRSSTPSAAIMARADGSFTSMTQEAADTLPQFYDSVFNPPGSSLLSVSQALTSLSLPSIPLLPATTVQWQYVEDLLASSDVGGPPGPDGGTQDLHFSPAKRDLRGHGRKVLTRRANIRIRKSFFSFAAAPTWNLLPPEVVFAPSLSSFKHRLDKVLPSLPPNSLPCRLAPSPAYPGANPYRPQISRNDSRRAVICSHFGYYKGGYFSVSLEQLDGDIGHDTQLHGLIFEAGARYLDDEEDNSDYPPANLADAIKLALESLYVPPVRSAEFALRLAKIMSSVPDFSKTNFQEQSSVYLLLRKLADRKLPPGSMAEGGNLRFERQANMTAGVNTSVKGVSTEFPEDLIEVLRLVYKMSDQFGSLRKIPYRRINKMLTAKFTIRFPTSAEEGLYSFYLHNCAEPNMESGSRPLVNVTLRMVEKNPDSFLSAGQEPLPLLYAVMCCAYFMTSLAWLFYLRASKNAVFRIHYLMFAVVLVKAISLVFHGVNYFVIGKHGVHEEGWAVMYYITHIFRGALLFITILLIGAGWAFIKHMLTPRERNVFLIVIPLQILANVATIVIEESEAGTARYAVWKDIFIFVDLACCGAILFPVVWSIRHLQAASQTDGKAAINLRNLRLFRHFYILVICYVYFTRVIAYLLTITVPYSLIWIVELFKEAITFIFFVAVGYKFRPVNDNPYLLLPNDDEDEDTVMERIQLEDVWSQSGVTDGVTRLSRPQPARKAASRTGNNVKANAAGKKKPGSLLSPDEEDSSLDPDTAV
ncbi:unnamed protein product [Calicophoron daubneyi]|uniref:GOST seven transmembrane domain-containing protein n=1 Tax=Calicophoron daubneyi TaxID=300641 RepID=A0AAV2T4T8_CALDB